MTCPTHSALQLRSHNLVMNSPVLKSFVYLLSFEPWIERISIFMVSRSKFLRAGGLAKLSVLTQLIGSGFVENSRLVFFLCCFYLPPCDQDCSMVCLWGHRIFCLLTLAFPSARPLEVQAFLVCTSVAVLSLKHSHKSPVWLKCWLWFLFSVPNTSVNS